MLKAAAVVTKDYSSMQKKFAYETSFCSCQRSVVIMVSGLSRTIRRPYSSRRSLYFASYGDLVIPLVPIDNIQAGPNFRFWSIPTMAGAPSWYDSSLVWRWPAHILWWYKAPSTTERLKQFVGGIAQGSKTPNSQMKSRTVVWSRRPQELSPPKQDDGA